MNQNWRRNGTPVTLPHDARITEKRSKESSDSGHGYFSGGVYTYEPSQVKNQKRKYIRPRAS